VNFMRRGVEVGHDLRVHPCVSAEWRRRRCM
jgi:hypothetical protein